MLFNSLHFLIFFPVVTLVYFVIPEKVKNLWLLVVSYYFYMCWQPTYALLILFSTVSTFLCSIAISKAKTQKLKKISLGLSVCINLFILFLFKYYNFFAENLVALFDNFGVKLAMPTFSLLLPVGISFYTFQALGYAVDVYRGTVEREKSLLKYALFVSFFPQLVAGPIERSAHLLPQFDSHSKFEYTRVKKGLVLMAWGFFKKLVIADGFATFVTIVYSAPHNYTGVQMIIATIMFTFQIYCDFSGYSDIARGCAAVLGFDLMRNFNKPYLSTSIKMFWERWHISLTSFFKSYVYIPLGGSRKGELRTYINIIIVFFVSGLWHGASWTFVIWGLLHAVYRIAEDLIHKYWKYPSKNIKYLAPIKHCGKILLVFFLVSFTYIFFRANTMSDATYIVTHLFSNINMLFTEGFLTSQLHGILFYNKNGIPLVLCAVLMIVLEIWEGDSEITEKISQQKPWIRWIFYYSIISLILFYGNFGKSPFVYFDF